MSKLLSQEVIDTAVTRALHLNPGYKFVKLINGYKRFDPTRGIDYLLDLLMETDRVDEKQTCLCGMPVGCGTETTPRRPDHRRHLIGDSGINQWH